LGNRWTRSGRTAVARSGRSALDHRERLAGGAPRSSRRRWP